MEAVIISLANGPRFIAAKRSDRSMDQFYNHDDKEAEKKKTQYTTFDDAGRFTGFTVREEGNNVVVTANYKLGCFDQAVRTIAPDGTAAINFTYNFSGVVDLMGVMFDYPEDKVLSKRSVGDGPYPYGRTVCMVRSWAYGEMSIMIPFLPKALLSRI